MTNSSGLTLNEKVILAAVDLSDADVSKEFTAEDLVVAAWRHDQSAFGLRGHEDQHPDSNKLYTKIDGKSGLVAKGYLRKAGHRTLRITEAALAEAIKLGDEEDLEAQEKLERLLQSKVKKIIEHPEFQSWLKDPSQPSRFRGAGHFWGIAPGTPASTVRSHVMEVDQVLDAALSSMDARDLDEIVSQRGSVLFDRTDLERAREFQETLKERFRSELKMMDPKGTY